MVSLCRHGSCATVYLSKILVKALKAKGATIQIEGKDCVMSVILSGALDSDSNTKELVLRVHNHEHVQVKRCYAELWLNDSNDAEEEEDQVRQCERLTLGQVPPLTKSCIQDRKPLTCEAQNPHYQLSSRNGLRSARP